MEQSRSVGEGQGAIISSLPQTRIEGGGGGISYQMIPPFNSENIGKIMCSQFKFRSFPFYHTKLVFFCHTMWHTQFLTRATNTKILAFQRAKKVSSLFYEGSKI